MRNPTCYNTGGIVLKKWIVSVVVMVVLLSSMYLTKPTEDMYADWLLGVVIEKAGANQPLQETTLKIFGKKMIENNSEYNDFVFFTIHKTQFKGKEMKFIGVYNSFVPIMKEK